MSDQAVEQVTAPRDRLDGDDLRDMLKASLALLERNVAAVDALNVFPVPDGDTGTNMFLTLQDAVKETASTQGAPAGEVAAATWRGAFGGARGNSGVILSQFFKGIAQGLEGSERFGVEELVAAYRYAKEHAYRSVGEPVEGTILTVITSVAEAAREAMAAGASIQDLCEAVCEAATDSVARTPTMLPVLRQAGVVDAGGQGLAVILEGLRRSVTGETSDDLEIEAPSPIGIESTPGAAVSEEFLVSTEEDIYGYCTQFLIRGEDLDIDAIRQAVGEVGRSAVVVGDDTMVRVHAHAEDPGLLLSLGASRGTLGKVDIRNMDEQHTEFSAARRDESVAEKVDVAVVAVALGDGLAALFTELGASRVVAGGDTMNPSVKDLMEAVESAPSDNIILLPNNKNILPAAQQVAEGATRDVRVIPTRSVPEGVSALLSFNVEEGLETNVEAMEEAASGVRSGEITKAVRDVTLDGVEVGAGMLIGLLDHKLVVSGTDLAEMTLSVIGKAEPSEGEVITLYRGEPVKTDEGEAVQRAVASAFPDAEVELVDGGQPHYHFLVSIE